MERLEPILKQKFWILLGAGLLMTLVGWWLATSSMASQIATRTKEIDEAFGRVPSGLIPNESWSTQLAARNTEQDIAKQTTARVLWERQKERMSWPNTVEEFAWPKGHRDEGYRGEIGLTGRENYRTAYSYDVNDVWQVVRPFDPLTGSGIVVFGTAQNMGLPHQKWGVLAPSSAEMWDAQEDLWILRSILQSILAVNGGPEGTRADAWIHAIQKLELHGGQSTLQRKPATASGPAAKPGAGPSAAHGSMPMGGLGGGGAGGGAFGVGAGGTGAAGGSSALASADFDWREEFGDDGSGGGQGGAGPGGPGSSSGPGPMMSSGSSSSAGAGAKSGAAGAAAAAATPRVRRYIDDDKSLPYKTRGFYLSVVMHADRIPHLITELTANENSAWPVEIVRVQMARIHDDDVEGGGSGPGAGPRSDNSITSLLQPAGGAGPGSGSESFGSFGSGSSSSFGSGGAAVGGPGGGAAAAGANPQAEAAIVALKSVLEDPFMAKVTLCGVVTIYNEVKPDPKATSVAPAAADPSTPKAGASSENTSVSGEKAPADAPAKPDGNGTVPNPSNGASETPAVDLKGADPKGTEPKPSTDSTSAPPK